MNQKSILTNDKNIHIIVCRQTIFEGVDYAGQLHSKYRHQLSQQKIRQSHSTKNPRFV